jgi:hypothetical protein
VISIFGTKQSEFWFNFRGFLIRRYHLREKENQPWMFFSQQNASVKCKTSLEGCPFVRSCQLKVVYIKNPRVMAAEKRTESAKG